MLLILHILLVMIKILYLVMIWLTILIVIIMNCWSFRFGFGYFPLLFHIFPFLNDLFDPFPISFKLMYQFCLFMLFIWGFLSFSMLFCEITFKIIGKFILLLLNINHFLTHVDKMLQKVWDFWNVRNDFNLKLGNIELGLYHSKYIWMLVVLRLKIWWKWRILRI